MIKRIMSGFVFAFIALVLAFAVEVSGRSTDEAKAKVESTVHGQCIKGVAVAVTPNGALIQLMGPDSKPIKCG